MKRVSILVLAAGTAMTACNKHEIQPAPATPSAPVKPVTISWQKTFGGQLNDVARAVVTTDDGGFVVAGSVKSTDGECAPNKGEQDIFIAKYNASAAREWVKIIGSSGYEECKTMIRTPDGGYLVAGQTGGNNGDVSGNHGGDDAWVVKLDAGGNMQWQKCYGGFRSDFVNAAAVSQDGNFVLAGISESNNGDVSGNHGGYDAWVLKISTAGQLIWQKSLGGSGTDAAHGIACRADGSIVIGAYSESADGDMGGTRGSADTWLVKLNAAGDFVWKKSYGGSGTDYLFALTALPGGGYAATGYTTSNDGDISGYKDRADVFVIRVDESGNKLWMKPLGGMGTDIAHAIGAATDGGILVAGYTISTDGDMPGGKGENDLFVLKLDAAGALQWQKTAGSSSQEEAYGITATGANSCIIAARTFGNDKDVTGNHQEGSSDAWIIRVEK